MDIREYIISSATELNIDVIGFIDSSPLNIKETILSRRQLDKFTEFEERDIEKRINPKLTMSECKSIIVIGVSYNTGFRPEKEGILKGNISMSSWGIDYHKVLQTKLQSLIEKMKRKINFEYKVFVDTGPLVERELARRAGLGFLGKNCSMINEKYGSFIFLGHILTNIEIKSDSPIDKDCGDCDLCIKACPTGALESPYNINPKKCISYLTQTKTIIPEDLRGKIGTRIYGCDTCQNVCPKNKGVRLSSHEEFIPYETGVTIDLEKILFMSNKDFKKGFGTMAGSWRGKNILKRNAIIILGNLADERNISILLKLKNNSNEFLDPYIDWAIRKIMKKQNK